MEAADAPKKSRSALATVFLLVFEAILYLLLCLALPIMIGCQSPILLIIYGIALWEAWKFSARRVLPITGPFQIGSQTARAPSPSTGPDLPWDTMHGGQTA
jgi:hypothetical protein